MVTVPAGAPHTVALILDDGAGNKLHTTALTYLVKDENERVVQASQALAGFVADADAAAITISSTTNTLTAPVAGQEFPSMATDAYRQLRTVVATCTLVGGGTVVLETSYVIQLESGVLIPGVNSFQTMAHARMTALDIPGLTYFDKANDEALSAALMQAAEKIKRFRFKNLDDSFYEQNVLWVAGWPVGNLSLLNPSSFLALPAPFLRALRMAQVAETEAILAGPSGSDRRDDGIQSEQIGDVMRTYRAGSQVKHAVSKAAIVYLGRYIDYGMRLNRT